jgi:uncharacterized protein YjbJ (UPF0337 family)
MKRSTKNQIKGRGRELKGNIKEKTGRATNNRSLEAEGTLGRMAGKAQKKAGDIEQKIDDDLDEEIE